jgi:Asp-tRNA(Asn)/Glu-tRNA(Gln) amidotransferase A subunit family amidase
MLEEYVPGEDAVAVERLNAAGAILVGKTNVPNSPVTGRRSMR